jgi:hypothetical protein
MSLNYTLTGIKNHEAVCWRVVTDPEEQAAIRNHPGFMPPTYSVADDGTFRVMSPVTQSLIFAMMGLGLGGDITAKNVEEAVIQVAIHQRVYGALLMDPNWADRYITGDEVRAHVGLHTNCFGSSNTKAAFHRRIIARLGETSVEWVLSNPVWACAKPAAEHNNKGA